MYLTTFRIFYPSTAQPARFKLVVRAVSAATSQGTTRCRMRHGALALAGLAAAAAVLHLGRKKKRQQPEGAATGVIFTGTGAAETFAFCSVGA